MQAAYPSAYGMTILLGGSPYVKDLLARRLLLLHNLPLEVTSDPGSGRRDKSNNDGCVLTALEACRCNSNIEASIPESCMIPDSHWKFWLRMNYHLNRRVLAQRSLMHRRKRVTTNLITTHISPHSIIKPKLIQIYQASI